MPTKVFFVWKNRRSNGPNTVSLCRFTRTSLIDEFSPKGNYAIWTLSVLDSPPCRVPANRTLVQRQVNYLRAQFYNLALLPGELEPQESLAVIRRIAQSVKRIFPQRSGTGAGLEEREAVLVMDHQLRRPALPYTTWVN